MTKFDQDPVGAGAGVRDQRARGRLSQADYREKVEAGGPCEGRHQPLTGPAESGQGGAWGVAADTQGLEQGRRNENPVFSTVHHTDTNPGVFSLPGASLRPSLREPLPVLAKLCPWAPVRVLPHFKGNISPLLGERQANSRRPALDSHVCHMPSL